MRAFTILAVPVLFSTWSHHVLTSVRYVRLKARDDVTSARRKVELMVDEELNAVLMVNSKMLKEEHVSVWNTVSIESFAAAGMA